MRLAKQVIVGDIFWSQEDHCIGFSLLPKVFDGSQGCTTCAKPMVMVMVIVVVEMEVVMVVANKIIDGKSHFCPRCLVALSITLTIPAWLQAENTTRPWSGFKPRIVFTKIIIIIITNTNITIIIVIR